MKKIVRQQNYLRELIDSQDNKVISKGALKCLIRAVLEPLLDKPEEGVVLYRIINLEGLLGPIKRLEFSDIDSFDFSDKSGNLREKVWANTEFIIVMTQRFVSVILWDNRTDDEGFVRYYSIYNSKLQSEALDIINRNTIIDIKKYQEKFRPDRRDNKLLNSSIRRLIENMDEASKDAVMDYAEDKSGYSEYDAETRCIAHELKNQLSICDLYSEIIRKYCAKNNITDSTIINAADCITKAVKMGNNSLIALKSSQSNNLEPCSVKELTDNVRDLTKVYFECKNIEYIVENDTDAAIVADKDKMCAVLINLVKNAVEAFGEDVGNGKYIKIVAEKDGDFAKIRVLNNAGIIEKPELVFEKGFTTKSNGSGLGLYICKKFVEEQLGQLTLEHTDDEYTEFVISMGLV